MILGKTILQKFPAFSQFGGPFQLETHGKLPHPSWRPCLGFKGYLYKLLEKPRVESLMHY